MREALRTGLECGRLWKCVIGGSSLLMVLLWLSFSKSKLTYGLYYHILHSMEPEKHTRAENSKTGTDKFSCFNLFSWLNLNIDIKSKEDTLDRRKIPTENKFLVTSSIPPSIPELRI